MRNIRIPAFCFASLLLSSCGGEDSPPPPTPSIEAPPTVTFSETSLEAIANLEPVPFNYSVSPNRPVSLSSSDTDIFAIENGAIIPQGMGSAKIEARYQGRIIASLPVNVRAFELYSIGNSLTYDYKPFRDFRDLATSQNIGISNGWHINCGQNLETIFTNPSQTCNKSAEGNFPDALAATSYDAITLQPFCNVPSAEVEALVRFIEYIRTSRSGDAAIYVYLAWPANTADPLTNFDYSKAWAAPFDPQVSSCMNDGFARYIKTELETRGVDVAGYIEVGKAFYNIDRNVIPGGSLFRDRLHANNAGQFTAATSVLHAIFDQVEIENFDLPGFKKEGEKDIDLTDELRQKIIAQVAAP